MTSITISEKHGVNPGLEQCFYCMKDVGVALFGKLEDDAEAPRRICFGPGNACDECKGYMEQGVILISVDESRSTDKDNPYRTGGWVVVRDKAIKRIIAPPELVRDVLKRRMAFVPDEAWDMLGLPRGESNESSEETGDVGGSPE